MRLVMFGTGPFAAATFRALCDSPHQVVALVTQPPRVVRGKVVAAASPVRDEAARRGTPILDPSDINAADARAQLAALSAELFVVADYGQILSAETLALAPLGAINLHGSLLPKYRGAAPINWAIYNGEPETGVSVIHMTPRVDAGPVLAQASTPIGADETAVELETRLAALGAPLVLQTIAALAAGTAAALPQDMALATKARRLRKSDGAIDWSRTASEIKNQVRALEPWPKSFTNWLRAGAAPLRLIIGRVSLVDEAPDDPPGEVLRADKDAFWIATGKGAINIEQIQPAGKHLLSAAEFLRGYPVGPGELFGPAPEDTA